jgi:hypothetical protein
MKVIDFKFKTNVNLNNYNYENFFNYLLHCSFNYSTSKLQKKMI